MVQEDDERWVFVSDIRALGRQSYKYTIEKVKVLNFSYDRFFANILCENETYSRLSIRTSLLYEKDQIDELVKSIAFQVNDLVLCRNVHFGIVKKLNKCSIQLYDTITGKVFCESKNDCIIVARGEKQKGKKKKNDTN